MTHRQILETLSGLLLGLFVAILSSTVVTNALPRIIADLGASDVAYTWVVTSALLAVTASTPIWGKLADLTSKKTLVQIALGLFVLGSVLAGVAQNVGELIACRVLQGVGAGGLVALAQVVMAAIIAPRERGRYAGHLGAVMAAGTIGGPLVGGVVVDTSWLGWRWVFYLGVPFAIAASFLIQKTLRLPVVKRDVTVDYLGATLVTAAVSALLVWVTLAGHEYAWVSPPSALLVTAALVLGAAAVAAERRAVEPVIPLRLYRDRTVVLATTASVFVGLAMFGATVFLAQYFQLGRGHTPTEAGLLTIPMIAGLVLTSTVVGRLITRWGRWKGFLVAGTALLTTGFALMATLDSATPMPLLAVYMFVVGTGVGMTMQNLVLAVQNTIDARDLGAGSSAIVFFRSLGGAVGVAALGAVLVNRVDARVADGLAALGVPAAQPGGGLPDLATLPVPVRQVIADAYGAGTAEIFLVATPFALLALVAVLFIREVPLRGRAAPPPVEPGAAPAPATALAAATR